MNHLPHHPLGEQPATPERVEAGAGRSFAAPEALAAARGGARRAELLPEYELLERLIFEDGLGAG